MLVQFVKGTYFAHTDSLQVLWASSPHESEPISEGLHGLRGAESIEFELELPPPARTTREDGFSPEGAHSSFYSQKHTDSSTIPDSSLSFKTKLLTQHLNPSASSVLVSLLTIDARPGISESVDSSMLTSPTRTQSQSRIFPSTGWNGPIWQVQLQKSPKHCPIVSGSHVTSDLRSGNQ